MISPLSSKSTLVTLLDPLSSSVKIKMTIYLSNFNQLISISELILNDDDVIRTYCYDNNCFTHFSELLQIILLE